MFKKLVLFASIASLVLIYADTPDDGSKKKEKSTVEKFVSKRVKPKVKRAAKRLRNNVRKTWKKLQQFASEDDE